MYRACLKHNPFLWTAFEALCDMGEGVMCEVVCVRGVRCEPRQHRACLAQSVSMDGV